MFDFDSFIESGAQNTRFQDEILPPASEEFRGVLNSTDDIKNFTYDRQDGGKLYKIALRFHLDEPRVREVTNNDDPTVEWSCILDVNEDTGQLSTAPGDNRRLKALKRALKQDERDHWGPQMAVGVPVMCRIVHNEFQGNVRAEVSRVRPID